MAFEQSVSFCGAELDALSGLPDRQFRLYFALRCRMDVKSRMVGSAFPVSYAALARDIEVAGVPGRHVSKAGKPGLAQMRAAVRGLEAAGLVESRGNGEVLVFLLPKARRASARPKQERQGNDRVEQQHYPQAKYIDFVEEIDISEGYEQQGVNVEERHISLSVNPFSVVNTAAQRTVSSSELSTGYVLPLPLLGLEMADKLRSWERSRGKRLRIGASDPVLAQWVRHRLTPAEFRQAYDQAVAIRERDNCPSPVNAGLMNALVGAIVAARGVCKGSVGQGRAVWFNDPAGVLAMAQQLGQPKQQHGESASAFRQRVIVAHSLHQDQQKLTQRRRK